MRLLDDKEADQFEIVQPFDLLGEEISLDSLKEAINIAAFFDGDDAANGIAKQLGICPHLESVTSLVIELLRKGRDRLVLALAETAELIQQLLRGKVVHNDGTIVPEINRR